MRALTVVVVGAYGQRGLDSAAGRSVRDRVAYRYCVRPLSERERDGLARREPYGLPTRCLARQRVSRRVEGEDRPVRRGVLCLLLDDPELGATSCDERGVNRGDGHAWGSRGSGSRAGKRYDQTDDTHQHKQGHLPRLFRYTPHAPNFLHKKIVLSAYFMKGRAWKCFLPGIELTLLLDSFFVERW
ncbi:MAG TPA: hypothetical protein VFN23_01310 [Ktedonobacteraceae bacterium]|nr:hypothetical protein [Ktedonobacteraceae bacterium]